MDFCYIIIYIGNVSKINYGMYVFNGVKLAINIQQRLAFADMLAGLFKSCD